MHSIQEGDQNIPSDTNLNSEPSPKVPYHHPLSLAAFHDDSASAFQYLKQLLNLEKTTTTVPDTVSLRRPRTSRFPFQSRRAMSVYHWTTALAVAARDKKVSSKTLKQLFESVRTRTIAFRPTVATYSVLMRGLIHRRDYEDAEEVWGMLIREGLVLDRKALTVGLQVLTRAGHPHQAFCTLEEFAAKPDARGVIPLKLQSRPPGRIQGPIVVTSIVMNEFMVALLRIGRPDVVFKLWDHMETLYGVSPDAISLNILLKSARLSAKLDDSFAGVMSHLASKNPFRKHRLEPLGREDVGSDIKQMLSEKSGYRTTSWNNMPAWQWAIRIFQHVILGNWPHLKDIPPPANAIHTSGKVAALHPMGELAQRFGGPRINVKSNQTRVGPYPLYPQIFPEDATFFAYIQLLGIQSLAYEIPLALAWMRELEIVPSKDTLAMALVFWAEISLHSPLIESLVGERSEYARLVRWIRDWVGHEKVPREEDIRHWLRVVAIIRDGGR
jgi:pentatricopeptide repeat protein